MKKNKITLCLMGVLVLTVSQVRAEDSMPSPQNDNEYNMQNDGLAPERGSRQEPREMRDGSGMEKMKGGMGKGMMHHQPSVVATSDGGIVVLDGPRLLKYDSQLNLVGEAELKPGKKGPQMNKGGDESAAEPVAQPE